MTGFTPSILLVVFMKSVLTLNLGYEVEKKHAIRILKRTGRKKMTTSLNLHEEFPSTLMRLRLGLLNEDVADCFDISPTKSSFIF